MNIAQLWDTILSFDYNKDRMLYSLSGFLKQYKDKRILDCACGTGFLTLDLIKQGYDITCTDGSETMLSACRKKAQAMKVKVNPERLLWSQLGQRFENQFDVVMCRGSSLIYASGWEQANDKNFSAIQDSLHNFYKCLKPGGMLYVDTTCEHDLGKASVTETYFPRKVGAHTVQLQHNLSTNRQRKLRTWKPTVYFDKKPYSITRYSTYLPHQELTSMLQGVGFADIQGQDIDGECYDVFTAEKVAA